VSQTFIQLVMLSVIMVGQNIVGRAADERSDMTYQDAEATCHEANEIQSPPEGAGRRARRPPRRNALRASFVRVTLVGAERFERSTS
jgi:hypothetical protein